MATMDVRRRKLVGGVLQPRVHGGRMRENTLGTQERKNTVVVKLVDTHVCESHASFYA